MTIAEFRALREHRKAVSGLVRELEGTAPEK